MRQLNITVILLMVILLLTACSSANNSDENTFIATVLENDETSLLVEPAEDSTEARSADKVHFSIADAAIVNNNNIEIPIEEIEVGSQVEISYSGAIAESYPAQIYDCFRVKLLD